MVFKKIDHEIWYALWRWAKRRHPNKGSRWVKDQYFTQKGLRNYCFLAKEKGKDGIAKEIVLIKASDTPIVRHVKIRKDANIYDPTDEEYFEARKSAKIRNSTTGSRRLIPVFRK